MALVQSPIKYHVELMDSGKNRGRMQFVSNGFSAITAETLLNTLYTDVAALTDAKIMGYGFSYAWKENTENGALTECNVEEYADLQVALVQATPPAPGQSAWGTVKIPAPKATLRLGALGSAEYNEIDVTDADLLSLLGLFQAGLGLFPALTLSDGQTIEDPSVAGNVEGWVYMRASRQGRR
jgi:hypothetical protein